MNAVCLGQADAYAELYRRYHRRGLRLAQSICGQWTDSEDAVQDAFLSLWRNPRSYRADRGTVAAWLLGTVRNRAIDVMRRNGRELARQTVAQATCLEDDGPADLADATALTEQVAEVRAALLRLPERQREAICLSYYAGLSHTEIARRVGLPLGTVKGQVRLGVGTLERRLARPSR
ncbi:RNA polymerase sigma factor [Conexibacter sp. DBS9H8]|uniref:RNA polymerase sigma factor n=1 Tax=Conexibacter sp. DBS9H8 TaxID=2937801 RepID=UPI00200D414D|nr:RNA polymerase sigma factor [Conexibacter sp. DBS9H8]